MCKISQKEKDKEDRQIGREREIDRETDSQ